MADHQPVQINPKELHRAQQNWQSFTHFGKWAVIATCVSLVLLALIFIDW